MTDVRKPSRVGFFAGGPPFSVQCRMSTPSGARTQVYFNLPTGRAQRPVLDGVGRQFV
jgi:hypothetical protein